MTHPAPLVFEPILLEKVWGGDRLARLGKPVRPGARIGESWELVDLDQTSPSGGGGQPARSRVASGPFAGRTIRELMHEWGRDMLGRAEPTPAGGFPLLVKFLDARENLSVQVHPSARYARQHPDAHLKSECWYIVEADTGSRLYRGLRAGADRAAFAAAVGQSDERAVLADLLAVDAVPGETHMLPSGTCHALGAGVLVAEIQTPSDTTFRLYDWGRKGRTLHVSEALACMDMGPVPAATRLHADADRGELVRDEHFQLEEHRLRADETRSLGEEDLPVVLMILRGGGRLEATDASFEPVELPVGTTALIPAACGRVATMHALGETALLRIRVTAPS